MPASSDSGGDRVSRLLAAGESAFAQAAEELVQRNAFGELLAKATENAMAVTKIGFDVGDLIVRNLRLAGRADINRLGHQIARTEDKLERVLAEVEALRAEREPPSQSGSPPPDADAADA